jgi:hypothetical protein
LRTVELEAFVLGETGERVGVLRRKHQLALDVVYCVGNNMRRDWCDREEEGDS